jgi:hypothetical protein
MSDSRAPFVIRRATVTDLETVGRMGAQLLRVHYD